MYIYIPPTTSLRLQFWSESENPTFCFSARNGDCGLKLVLYGFVAMIIYAMIQRVSQVVKIPELFLEILCACAQVANSDEFRRTKKEQLKHAKTPWIWPSREWELRNDKTCASSQMQNSRPYAILISIPKLQHHSLSVKYRR